MALYFFCGAVLFFAFLTYWTNRKNLYTPEQPKSENKDNDIESLIPPEEKPYLKVVESYMSIIFYILGKDTEEGKKYSKILIDSLISESEISPYDQVERYFMKQGFIDAFSQNYDVLKEIKYLSFLIKNVIYKDASGKIRANDSKLPLYTQNKIYIIYDFFNQLHKDGEMNDVIKKRYTDVAKEFFLSGVELKRSDNPYFG